MTEELQNELQTIRSAVAQVPANSVLAQNAMRALEIVEKALRPFGYEEYYPLRACVWRRRDEWVLELEGEINDTSFTVRHPQPGHIPPEDVPGLDHDMRIPVVLEGEDLHELKLECCRSILGQDIELMDYEIEKIIHLNRNYWDGYKAASKVKEC